MNIKFSKPHIASAKIGVLVLLISSSLVSCNKKYEEYNNDDEKVKITENSGKYDHLHKSKTKKKNVNSGKYSHLPKNKKK